MSFFINFFETLKFLSKYFFPKYSKWTSGNNSKLSKWNCKATNVRARAIDARNWRLLPGASK